MGTAAFIFISTYIKQYVQPSQKCSYLQKNIKKKIHKRTIIQLKKKTKKPSVILTTREPVWTQPIFDTLSFCADILLLQGT